MAAVQDVKFYKMPVLEVTDIIYYLSSIRNFCLMPVTNYGNCMIYVPRHDFIRLLPYRRNDRDCFVSVSIVPTYFT